MGKSIEDRLNDELEIKDGIIEELKDKIDNLEIMTDIDKIWWMRHSVFDDCELSQEMEVPRLEMRLERDGVSFRNNDSWYSRIYTTGLVYRHFKDAGINNKLLFIPLDKTTTKGGKSKSFKDIWADGDPELPFSDGSHIVANSITLNLPAYIVCYEKNIFAKINYNINEDINLSIVEQMKRKI